MDLAVKTNDRINSKKVLGRLSSCLEIYNHTSEWVRRAKAQLALNEARLSNAVALDSSLKNDVARKAAKARLGVTDSEYIDAATELDLALIDHAEAEADLELIRTQIRIELELLRFDTARLALTGD